MSRSTNNVASRRRRKRILKKAKGYWGRRKNIFRTAKLAVEKGWLYAYRDRRARKRNFRRLWITRINAAARLNGLSYSRLMNGLKIKQIEIDRKILAELAVNDPTTFSDIASLYSLNQRYNFGKRSRVIYS